MHKSVMYFGIEFIDPDNAEALFAIKAHLCAVLYCPSVQHFECVSLDSDTGWFCQA